MSVTGSLATSAVLDDRFAAQFLQILLADALALLRHELALDVGARHRITLDVARSTDRHQHHALVDLGRTRRLAGGRGTDFLAVVASELACHPPSDIADDHVLQPLRQVEALVAASEAHPESFRLAPA